MYSKKIQFLLLATGLVTSSCGTDKSNSTRNAEPTKATEPNSEEANSNKQDPANPNTQVNQNTNAPSTNTNTTSPTTNLRLCTGKILPFAENTPYLTKKIDLLDATAADNMLKSTCGLDDVGAFKIIADRKDVYYTCREAQSLWCEFKNSDALTTDKPGNPLTHLGSYVLNRGVGFGLRDSLLIEIRFANGQLALYLTYSNAAGGGGVSVQRFATTPTDWTEFKCSVGCVSNGKLQVKVEAGTPKTRILKSDNSTIDIPLVAVP